MTDPLAGNIRPTSLGPTSLDDRRRRPRRGSGHDDYTVSVIDGLGAGEKFACVFREVTPETASLLVRAELRVGQRVRVQQMDEGQPIGAPIIAEVIRSRPLTAGRYDVLIEHRKPAEAPKPSESQRRHERRLARLARLNQANPTPVMKSI